MHTCIYGARNIPRPASSGDLSDLSDLSDVFNLVAISYRCLICVAPYMIYIYICICVYIYIYISQPPSSGRRR